MTTNDASRRHESAKFGGLQFTQELESCFDGLTKILGRILDSEVKNLSHPVGLVAGNIHHNARAILSLAPDALLSEAHLVMRVMVDSALTASYLLVVGAGEREAYSSQLPSGDVLRSGSPDELIQQAKTLNQLDQIPAHRLKSLNERIEAVCAMTGTNPDTWRMVVASIFPQTADLLTGSVHAYAFRFKATAARNSSGGDGGEFSMLFLMGSDVLYELIGILAKHISIESWRSEAETVHQRVFAVMANRNTGIDDPVQGAWERLDRLEHFGTQRLSPHLAAFEDAFKFSYEAALIAPTLRKESDRERFKLAALYFRRALNDLRTVWLLLSRGYTAQASTCAGSLFETSLASICLLQGNNVQAFEAKLCSATGNDFPWGPMEMAKMACAMDHDLSALNPTYENSWRSLYARYVWLSQIRHSTFQSIIHDIRASMLDCGGYLIMAIPNCTDEDLPVKLGIAVGAIADIQDATNSLLVAFGYQKETGNALFDARKLKAETKISELVQKFSQMKNPITIARTRFMLRHPPVPETKTSSEQPI